MKWKILGLLTIVLGAALGIWLGLWVCLAGGIIQVVEAITAKPLSASDLAFGIVRIVSAGFVGWGSFYICFSLGISMLSID